MDDGLNYHVLLSVVGTDSTVLTRPAGTANVTNVFPSLMIGIATRHDMQLYFGDAEECFCASQLACGVLFLDVHSRIEAFLSAASPPLFESA
jgi:hypothetical protein